MGVSLSFFGCMFSPQLLSPGESSVLDITKEKMQSHIRVCYQRNRHGLNLGNFKIEIMMLSKF